MIHPDYVVFKSSNSRYYIRRVQVPYDEYSCFGILPASTITGFGIFKGMSLLCNFNIHINCQWIWLASFSPCWCHYFCCLVGQEDPPGCQHPPHFFFLILNCCFTNFTATKFLHCRTWWKSVQIQPFQIQIQTTPFVILWTIIFSPSS